MKYTKEEYENIEFYFGEEDVTNHTQKIVITRKTHQCADCQKEINSGENAICEKGFMDGQPVSCYHCIDCCDKCLDEIDECDDCEVVCTECTYCIDNDCDRSDSNRYGQCVDGIAVNCDLFKER